MADIPPFELRAPPAIDRVISVAGRELDHISPGEQHGGLFNKF